MSSLPADATFRLLLAQLDGPGSAALLPSWMAAQPGVAAGLDSLVCDGKTLRGSIAETASAAASFMAQVSLHSQSSGVAIAEGIAAVAHDSRALLMLLG